MKRTSFLISSSTERVQLFFKNVALVIMVFLMLRPGQVNSQIFTKLSNPLDKNSASGCGWIDYNNDGKIDAYLSYFNIECRLYSLNNNSDFELVNKRDMIPSGSNFSAFSWGDYDNDGFADLYITSMSGNNALFRNLGDGHFERITNSVTTKDGGSFLSCNWIDYDNDGNLDLFVTASGTGFTPGSGNNNLLYKNNGDGTFSKVTDIAITSQKTFSNCAGFADIDNDGDQDLFLTEWGKTTGCSKTMAMERFQKSKGQK